MFRGLLIVILIIFFSSFLTFLPNGRFENEFDHEFNFVLNRNTNYLGFSGDYNGLTFPEEIPRSDWGLSEIVHLPGVIKHQTCISLNDFFVFNDGRTEVIENGPAILIVTVGGEKNNIFSAGNSFCTDKNIDSLVISHHPDTSALFRDDDKYFKTIAPNCIETGDAICQMKGMARVNFKVELLYKRSSFLVIFIVSLILSTLFVTRILHPLYLFLVFGFKVKNHG